LGLCPIKRPSFSTGGARAASHISVWRVEGEREREREGERERGREGGRRVAGKEEKLFLPMIAAVAQPEPVPRHPFLLSSPPALALFTFEYFVERPKLSAISSIISSRLTLDSSSL